MELKQTEATKCLLCGKTANLKTEMQKGYQEAELYSIYHCPFCNTSFSLPRSNTDAIYQLIYENGDKVPGYNRYWKYYREIKNQSKPIEYLANSEPAYWAPVYALKKVLNTPKDANILEIGSGLGYMTYSLRKDGYKNAVGLDIAHEAVNKAIDELGSFYICADANKYAKENVKKYDVVFMTEVIEHIEDPLGFIQSLIPLLKDGGTLIMTTPNKSIYPDNVIWATDKPPVHCWWFSEKSFKHLSHYFNMGISFINFAEYYDNHNRELINIKLYNNFLFNDYVFNKDNQLIKTKDIKSVKSLYILPKWIKKTRLYKKISCMIYPMLSKSFIKVGNNSNTLCVLLTKHDNN
ncbi:3-demethylubiquinone-9 3-methyltransferase [Bacteroidales bacterium Barb4]|nr:3-demethylubiquinone-9 3-methyltransferase [Bacteroidales bacterium Barb4]